MSKVLVTGGSGFIGSHMMELLLLHGHEVSNFDIKRPWHVQHDPYWHLGDIREAGMVREALHTFEPDIIIHLAARAEISSTNWSDFSSIHQGTNNLIAAIGEYGRLSRLINVSTQLVIGPEAVPSDIYDFHPYTTYGEAKVEAEKMLLTSDLKAEWVTVRPTNIWGPGHPSFATSIWKYLGKRQYLHPNVRPPVLRCYGYVGNTVEQIYQLMQAPTTSVNRQIYYLADGVLNSSLWVDAFAGALTGKAARRVPVELLRLLGYGGDIFSKLGLPAPIDSGRVMRMTTSYAVPLEPLFRIVEQPRISLEDGVAQTVAWLRESRS